MRALLTLLLCLTTVAHAERVLVGSKKFTESVILGEVARLALQQANIDVAHQRELGGSRILFNALRAGEIDVYPEYTGTLKAELLSLAADADLERVRGRLRDLGLRAGPPLGFENTYALGMTKKRAQTLSIASASDLTGHPDLNFAFSNEFLNRADGWPGLRNAYGLPQTRIRGLDHDLAYRGLVAGDVDLIEVYTTDAEIAYYDLAIVGDDRGFFPDYQALYVYRDDVSDDAVAALDNLGGRISVDAMRRMNAAVKIEGRSDASVAADLLGVAVVESDSGFWSRLVSNTLTHLWLVGVSLLAAILVAIPLGVAATRHRRLEQPILAVTGILQTIPSLALLVFMIPWFGIGAAPAIAALFIYSLLPIVRNTHAGIRDIPAPIRESAVALGLPRSERLRRIELPLAAGSILAGIKTAAVINVGTATLGALIGAGGYGQPILTGIRLDDTGLILEGAIPAALLALFAQGLFDLLERWITPRGLRL